jgi:hypothetical protein
MSDDVEFKQHDIRVEQLREYLDNAIGHFRAMYPELEVHLEDQSAEYIQNLYSKVIYPLLKKYTNDKINIYRIAASYELAVIKAAPLISDKGGASFDRHVNAHLAFSMAMTSMESMWDACGGDPDDLDESSEATAMGAVRGLC